MYHHHRRVVIVPLLSSATNDNHDIVSRQYYCFATAYPATSPLYFSKEEDQKMACKYVHIPFIIPAVSFAGAAGAAKLLTTATNTTITITITGCTYTNNQFNCSLSLPSF